MVAQVRGFARQFEMPWLADDINRLPRSMDLDQFIAAGEAIPPGVTARANTSMLLPPQIPDLGSADSVSDWRSVGLSEPGRKGGVVPGARHIERLR